LQITRTTPRRRMILQSLHRLFTEACTFMSVSFLSLLSQIGRKKTAKNAKDRQVNHNFSWRPPKEKLYGSALHRLGKPADASAKMARLAPKPS
jgi:hypothetical protein